MPLTGLLAAAVAALAGAIPVYGSQAADFIASFCLLELKLVEASAALLHPIVEAHPTLAAAFGAAWHGAVASLFATRLHDHFFMEFNDDVLRRIKRPLAFDPLWGGAGTPEDRAAPPIPWSPPEEPGTRKKAWEMLLDFARDKSGDGRTTLRGRPKHPDFVPFRWTVLTGRAGAGKTRMAVELARRLARRELLGSDDTGQRWAQRRLRHAEWWQRTLPQRQRRDEHPWDAGWLLPSQPEESDLRSARGVEEGFLDQLRDWLPRRPTFLLLDDPRPGDAQRIVETISARQERYRFPVRLLIVDQAVPLELTLPDPLASDTRYLRGFDGRLIALGEAARLTATDIRRMAAGLGLDSTVWNVPNRPGTDAQVEHFLRETRGNALLAELGLRWLKAGRKLNDITGEKLLEDRAARVVEALELVGITSHAHWRALASATIAGPLEDHSPALTAGSDRALLMDAFHVEFEPQQLRSLFNLAQAVNEDRLPPVRPELIGDAFVRFVLRKHCDEHQRSLVAATAWRLSARGTLRTAQRVNRHGDDLLAAVLRAEPPPEIDLDRGDIALGYAEAAVRITRDDWDAHDFAPGSAGLDSATARIIALPPPVAVRLLERLAAIMEVDNNLAVVRGWAGFACCCTAIERGLQDASAWKERSAAAEALGVLQRVFAATNRWGCDPAQEAKEALAVQPAALVMRLIAALEPELKRGSRPADDFARALWWRGRWAVPHAVGAVLAALAKPPIRSGEDAVHPHDAAALRLEAMAAAAVGDDIAASGAAAALDAMAKGGPDTGRAFELERAQAWRLVAYARTNDPAGCLAAVEQVERVALPRFAGERDFEYERAQAWRLVAYARTNDPAGCLAAVEQVERVALPRFAGEREFEHQRAMAWRSVAIARRHESAACLAAAEQVERIALPRFAGERDFELERAVAWRSVAYARNDPAGCLAAAEQVERIVLPRFAGERDFEYQRAQAWRNLALARGHDPAGCLAAVEQVERVALPRFAGERDFELERAVAWRSVAYARNDPAGCLAAAAQVERIALPRFAGERDFEYERAQAWRLVAYARTNDPAGCLAAVEQVERIALPRFAGERDFEYERAQAWRHVAYARTHDPAGCLAAVEQVEGVALPRFAGERDFEYERALAWCYVAYARRSDPAGCQAAAEMVDSIVVPKFIGDTEMEAVRDKARRYCAEAM